MKNRRPLCLVWRAAALTTACLLLASCGVLESDRTVVRLTHWGGAGDDGELHRTQRALHEEFQEENPDIRLIVEAVPDMQEYVTKLLLAHIAGTEPDIITMDASSAAVFIDNGVLLDLRPYIDRDPEISLDDFFPTTLEFGMRGEAIYVLPKDFTPMVMYYNKRLFDAAGVPHPQPGWDYSDFLEKAIALTGDGIYGFEFSNWMPGWIMWLWNNGADVLDPTGSHSAGYLDSQRSIQSMQFLVDLVNRHRVSPTLSESAAAGVDFFANGRAAMKIVGHWAIPGFRESDLIDIEDIGIIELPSQQPSSSTVLYLAGFAIGKNCRNPDAAWEYIKFMTRYENQLRYNRTGIAISARRDVAEELAGESQIEQRFIEIVEQGRAPWGSRVEQYDIIVEEAGRRLLDAVIMHGRDLATEARRTARQIDLELQRR